VAAAAVAAVAAAAAAAEVAVAVAAVAVVVGLAEVLATTVLDDCLSLKEGDGVLAEVAWSVPAQSFQLGCDCSIVTGRVAWQ
jgi:Zn finger protein HypA/HybF involved in hydrogenase expression